MSAARVPTQVKLSNRVVSTDHGLLFRSVQPTDQGLYYCLATENSFKRTVAKIRLRVLSSLTDRQTPLSPHPKVAQGALSASEALAMQRYCKEQQQAQRMGPLRGDLAKLKKIMEHRKSRSRRNPLPQD